MSTSSRLLSRRAFGRLAAGVAATAGAGALSACARQALGLRAVAAGAV
ncbi:hypothetical protein ACIPYR_02550 [Streptomyces parvus]